MGKKSPAPPPAPDYTGAAQQQGIANLEAARLTARLSNPNVITPLGTQTVSWGRPQFNKQAYDAAMAQWRAQNPQAAPTPAPSPQGAVTGAPTTTPTAPPSPTMPGYTVDEGDRFGYNRPTDDFALDTEGAFGAGGAARRAREDLTMPGGAMFGGGGPAGAGNVTLPNGTTLPISAFYGGTAPAGGYTGGAMPTPEMFTEMVDLDTPTILQQLTPEAQATLEAQQRVERAMAGLGEKAVGKVSDIYGTTFTPQGLPAQQFQFGGYGNLPTLPDLAGMGQFQRGVTAEGLPTAPDLMAMGRAGAEVGPQGVNYGPTAGQYGLAAGGPQGGLFGLAGAGPAAAQLGGLDLSGVAGVQGAPQGAQFGAAGGGPAAPTQIAGADLSMAGRVAGGPSLGQFGMAGGGPAGLNLASPQLGAAQGVAGGPQAGQYGMAGGVAPAERLQQGIDVSGLAQLPVGAGVTAQQAIMSRLEPQLQRERSQLETQLRNQGLVPGGEAYNAEVTLFNQRANDLMQQAALQGINLDAQMRAQGFSEQQIQAEMANQARQAQFGMGATQAQLANQAIGQNFQQALAAQQAQNVAQQQAFGQRAQQAEFERQGALQSFGTQQAAQQAYNQAVQQNLAQGLSVQDAQNRAQQQAFQQQMQTGQFGREAQQMAFQMGQQAQQAQNQAIAQNFQQSLAAQQAANAAQAQQYQQAMGTGEFARQQALAQFGMGQQAQQAANQAIAQNFAQAQASQQAYNQAVQQNMAMGLSAAEAQNRASQQLFQQQAATQEMRNQALAQQQAAAQQQYQNQVARQAQGFGQQMDIAGLYNASLAAQQQQALQQAQAQAALQAQGFNQAQAAAAFQNAQRQAALQEQLALRSQPLNEIAAIMGGAQVQMPQFQAYQGAEVAAAPIFGATQAAGNFAQQNYANQVGAYNAQMGLLGNIAGMAGTALGGPLGGAIGKGLFGGATPSDRRLKSNVVRIGTHPLGIGIYEYDIFGSRQRGVMADEVEAVKPEAVTTHPTEGYKMVYYGML